MKLELLELNTVENIPPPLPFEGITPLKVFVPDAPPYDHLPLFFEEFQSIPNESVASTSISMIAACNSTSFTGTSSSEITFF